MPALENLSFEQLMEGCEKGLKNAQSLAAEAGLLYEHKYFARTYSLGHLAREELGKVLMLYHAAIDVLVGSTVDWKKLSRRFRDHKEKIINDQMFQSHMMDVLKATNLLTEQEQGQWAAAQHLQFTKQATAYRNRRKNASLYVSWEDLAFQLPSEVFTERQAYRTWMIAKFACEDFIPIVESLRKWGAMEREQLFGFWKPVIEQIQSLQTR
jgi:AbiV family abortive infection protein